MTPQDDLALSLFKAGASLMQSAIEHAAGEDGDEKQREFFRRELEKKARRLEPRSGNGKIALPSTAETMLLSPPG